MKNSCFLGVIFSLYNLLIGCNHDTREKKEIIATKVKYDCNQFFGFNSLDSFTYCFHLSNNFRNDENALHVLEYISHSNSLTDGFSELLITCSRLHSEDLDSKVDTTFIKHRLKVNTKMPGFLLPDDQIIFIQDTPNVVYRFIVKTEWF
jgi:hypothetical protein